MNEWKEEENGKTAKEIQKKIVIFQFINKHNNK